MLVHPFVKRALLLRVAKAFARLHAVMNGVPVNFHGAFTQLNHNQAAIGKRTGSANHPRIFPRRY